MSNKSRNPMLPRCPGTDKPAKWGAFASMSAAAEYAMQAFANKKWCVQDLMWVDPKNVDGRDECPHCGVRMLVAPLPAENNMSGRGRKAKDAPKAKAEPKSRGNATAPKTAPKKRTAKGKQG